MEIALKGAAVPCRPSGVEPEGRLRGSGFAERQWLVRRHAQFVQLSELLYRVVELADGTRTLEQIARRLTASTRWEVTAEDVALVIQTRLVPLGLIADDRARDGAAPRRRTPPLVASARLRVLGPRAVDRLARVLQHVYRLPLVLAAVFLVAISQLWLFSRGDPSSAIQQVIATPLSLPLVAGLLIVAGVFHEFGHAAALRYGGGRARAMGVGLYLFIPVLYTDVSESYRLGRAARVRTDVGGLYFHLIAAAVFIAAGAATGNDFLLVAAFIIDLDIARQLIPFIRLDGYWLLADLTGIPDLFAHAAPRLRRRFGRGRAGPEPAPLRRGVGRIFMAYLLIAGPAIAGLVGYVAWHAPSIFDRTAAALSVRIELIDATLAAGDWGSTSLAVLEIMFLALPSIGLTFFFAVLLRALIRLAWPRRTAMKSLRTARAGAEPNARAYSQATLRPRSRRTGDATATMSLESAIAEHLELKRRHAEQDRATSRPEQFVAV